MYVHDISTSTARGKYWGISSFTRMSALLIQMMWISCQRWTVKKLGVRSSTSGEVASSSKKKDDCAIDRPITTKGCIDNL